MAILGITDRSKIRECMVTEKQGGGDEGEAREAREGQQGKTRRWVSMGVGERSREDPGEIHRSTRFGVQECQRRRERTRKGGRGWWDESEDKCGEVLWVSSGGKEGIRGVEGQGQQGVPGVRGMMRVTEEQREKKT